MSLFAALSGWLHAQDITANITNIVEPTGTDTAPTYVIDADASNGGVGYDRDKISASVSVFLSKNVPDFVISEKFRIKAQLLDDTGTPVTLAGASTFAYSAEQTITLNAFFPTTTVSFPLELDPDVDLGVGQDYSIKVWVQYEGVVTFNGISFPFWFDEDGPDTSSSFVVMHFTNTSSGDAARNIRGYTTGVPAWERSYAVRTASGFDSAFRVNVPYFLSRYDLGGASATVSMRLTVKMTNDLDQQVPLKNSGQYVMNLTMASMLTGSGLPDRPRSYSGNFATYFEPVSQLDSSNRTYKVRVTLEHLEVPTATYRNDGTTAYTGLQRLLHFNGNLMFGSRLTEFDSLSAAPVPGVIGVDYIQTQITVGSGAGSIPGYPSYTFGNGTTLLTVLLFTNGTCVVNGGILPMIVSGGGGVNATYGGITVNYPSVTLQSSGPVASSVVVKLPQGLGYNPDRTAQGVRYESAFSFPGSRTLSSSFTHSATLVQSIATDAWVFDESRPMLYRAQECKFTTDGILSFLSSENQWVHTEAMEELEQQQTLSQHQHPSMASRLTNEGYLRYVETPSTAYVDFNAASDGTVRTAHAQLAVQPGEMHTHFPLNAQVKWNGGGVYEIADGKVSGYLPQPDSLALEYNAACNDDPCGPAGGVTTQIDAQGYAPDAFYLTVDGGLQASCVMNPQSLQWGFKGDGSGGAGAPTHRTDEFSYFAFFASGNQLYDLNNPLLLSTITTNSAATLGPACVMLAGYNPDAAEDLVYPQTPDYRQGVGYYAGANFVVLAGSPDEGASRIADMPADSPYTLQEDVSKYYVRRSGLSGRQVAEAGTFTSVAELYGYGFTFSRFQLTFLSNENHDSWVNGSVDVPYPSQFTQNFEELRLACNGALESAAIDPNDNGEKDLRYWDGKFTPQAIRFVEETGAPCNAPRFLTMGLISGAANLDFPLSGSLGFLPDGNIAPMSANLDGVDGRLGLPATVLMDGPGDEQYSIVPVSKLYFNAYDAPGAPRNPSGQLGGGYVGFAGRCNVPFFEDLKLHVMTSAKSSVPANIYLTGGWTQGGDTFFSNRNFDANHRAFPPMGITVGEYRNPQSENAYVPRAQQSIFGMIDLDYPLEWNPSGRYFRTWGGDREVDLFVVDVQHQVEYLSADNAEITFGVQYDGLPQINLASAVFEEADKQIGAAKALVGGTSQEVTKTLYRGVDQIGSLVADQFEAVLDDAVDAMEDDVICPLYDELVDLIEASENGVTQYNNLADRNAGAIRLLLDSKFNAAGGSVATLQNRLNDLADAVGQAASVITRIDQALEAGELAIDAVAGQLTYTRELDGTIIPLVPPKPGIIARSPGGEREIVQKLVTKLLAELAPEGLGSELFSGLTQGLTAELNSQLNALLEEADPALDQVVSTLIEAKIFLSNVRLEIAQGKGIIEEFSAILTGATVEIQNIIISVREVTFDYLDQIAAAARIDDTPLNQARSLVDEFDKEEFVAMIRGELRDRLLVSNFVQQMQATLRGYISELEMALNSAIDAAFSEITDLCRELIDEFLGPIDDAVNGLAGDVNQYVGAGSLDGYAHIQGDTLRRLRIDAEVQLKVPDDMALKGFIEYNCYDSTTEGAACVAPGLQTVEVKIGAIDAPLDWVNPGVKADLTVWFTMGVRSSPSTGQSPIYPRGIGGSLVMKEGEINFESLKITKFGAAVAIGLDDCYLAATATVVISSYEATGGIFFGKSCSLAPLEMVDPDVAALVGPAPFTGAYVYGEVWIPLSETLLGIPSSCLFRISAGVGAGAFYFISGPSNTPTYGGKMLLGVSGEALCVVSIKGTVSMIGVMSNGSLRFSGKGTLTGKAGACPFCVKFSESARMTYQNGSWDVDF